MSENYTVDLIKKKIQIALVEEMHKKDIIDFCQYNHVINCLKNDMSKLISKLEGRNKDLKPLEIIKKM